MQISLNPANVAERLSNAVSHATQQLNGHMHQRCADMKQLQQDIQSGNVAGSKQELDAIQKLNDQIKTEQAGLKDLHGDISQVKTDFSTRKHHLADLKSAIQAGDKAAAHKAFAAIQNIQKQIQTDLADAKSGRQQLPPGVSWSQFA